MKQLLILFFSLFVFVQVNGQPLKESEHYAEIKQLVEKDFFRDWLYFRMKKNPLLTKEDIYRNEQLRSPSFLLPERFNYQPLFKIHVWEDMVEAKEDDRMGYSIVRSPYYFIIEKGCGLTAVKPIWPWSKDKEPDTVRLNIYDSIFPYDNRFLVRYSPYTKQLEYLSGNVNWYGLNNDPFDHSPGNIGDAAFFRGVQFGLRRIPRTDMEKSLIDSIRSLRPEYPDFVYTTAEMSYLTGGKLLIGGPENRVSDYIELIFYTVDPKKTGDTDYSLYEMRYVLPTDIKLIEERHMKKRKLSKEERDLVMNSYLRIFHEPLMSFFTDEELDRFWEAKEKEE